MRLDGRTALVTGGSAGIGFAIAHALSSRGAKLVIAARIPSALRLLRPVFPARQRRSRWIWRISPNRRG